MDMLLYAILKKYAKNYTDQQIALIGQGMKYKGSVSTYNNLPITGNKQGYVYTVSDSGLEYIWTITASSGSLNDWEQLGAKFKTINGESIIGEGNVDIRTYQPYKDAWGWSSSSLTISQFCNAIISDSTATKGMAYSGTISSASFFTGISGLSRAEVNVQVMGDSNKVLLLTATSSDIQPYHWELTYYNGGTDGWRAFGGSWGTISGTLSNQSDLQQALNNKQGSLTQEQLNAANSGINSTKVATYDGYASQINNKQDNITSSVGFDLTNNIAKVVGVQYKNGSSVAQSVALEFVVCEQAEYDAMETHPDNVFYIIKPSQQ